MIWCVRIDVPAPTPWRHRVLLQPPQDRADQRRRGAARPHRAPASTSPTSTSSSARPVVTDEAPAGHEVAIFGLGCFWGAEEIYWQLPGVYSTSVGYAGGHTPNPSYEEVCSGRTGHTEAIRIVYDPTEDRVRRPGEEVLRGARPDPGHAPGQRHRHAVPLRDLLHDPRAGADRPRADQDLRRRARPPAARRHHHRGQAVADVLLRRGLPPAVPRQEPQRLPLPRQHRREVPRTA